MDKKTACLVGAISALTPLAAAAAPLEKTLAEVLAPQSYVELLQPIPNASALLKEKMAAESKAQSKPRIETAQYYYYPDGPYDHHHHHHHIIIIIIITTTIMTAGKATPITTITITITIITTTTGTGRPY